MIAAGASGRARAGLALVGGVLLATCPASRAVTQAAVPATVQAADPVPKAFQEAMRTAGDGMAVAGPLIESPAFLLNSVRGEVLTRLGVVRRQVPVVRTTFDGRHLREGLRLLDELDGGLAALEREMTVAEPDQAAALEVLGAVHRVCDACHMKYREGDAVTGFRLKAALP